MAPKSRKFFKKNYSKKNKPKSKVKKYQPDKNKVKFKHIARNQESEDYLRRMRGAELKREARQQSMQDDSSEHDDSEGEPDPFEELLESITSKAGDNKKSQVSSDEESDDEGVEEEETEDLNQTESDIDHEYKLESENEEADIQDEEEEEGEENIEMEDQEIQENDAVEDEENETKEELPESDASDSEIELCDEKSKLKESEDPFSIHLDNDLSSGLLDAISSLEKNIEKSTIDWKSLGKLLFEIPQSKTANNTKPKALISLDDDNETYAKPGSIPSLINPSNANFIKNQIWNNLPKANQDQLEAHQNSSKHFTPLQREIFSIINNYQDFYYTQRNFNNAEEIRFVYSLHALNHALKTRARVLHHNAKLNKTGKDSNDCMIPEYCRDQGLTRPKVLIVVPLRDSAYKIVNNFIALFCNNDKSQIMNYSRFVQEFTGNELFFPKRNPKPEDYEKIFAGNVDDNFRLGLCLTKKNIRLYTDYYNSDIIIASPLGLRLTIGAPGEKDRDFDFLSSIEILIMDQAEIFYAQNWEHVLHFLDHLHLKPEKMLNTDFSRIRSWVLSGLSKFYCQTLLFTSHELPEFRSLYNNRMVNYRGKVRTINAIETGTIRHVTVNVPQIFQRIEVTSFENSFDERFNYFTKIVLPQYKSPTMAHCLVYVPSYFDYVRLRNYFKKEEVSFVQISEYSKDEKVARARDMFFHSSAHFLLYSERAHFFKRTRLKGIRNIIMYAPPAWPNFYSEILNLMHENYQNSRDGCENSMSVTLLYTKYDLMQVSAIVGSERAAKMAKVGKTTHMFMSD